VLAPSASLLGAKRATVTSRILGEHPVNAPQHRFLVRKSDPSKGGDMKSKGNGRRLLQDTAEQDTGPEIPRHLKGGIRRDTERHMENKTRSVQIN